MRNQIAPTKNLRFLAASCESLLKSGPNLPRLGILSAPSGWGKSIAAAWIAIKTTALLVRANATWTPISMLGAIGRELGLEPRGRSAAMLDRIVERLLLESRLLLIDECDYLSGKLRLLEMIRDIHDLAGVPILMIGMAGFARAVAQKDQIAGRVSQVVTFQPVDLDDAKLVAAAVCEVELDDELLAELHRNARGSIRELVAQLGLVEGYARRRSLKRLTRGDIPSERLVTGSNMLLSHLRPHAAVA